MAKLKNIHPGEVLQEEFLTPLGITAYRLSKEEHLALKEQLKSIPSVKTNAA